MNVSSQENDRIFGIELFHDLAKKMQKFSCERRIYTYTTDPDLFRLRISSADTKNMKAEHGIVVLLFR
jgi:hypothetical protein|nr:hypothetical protein [Bacillaceae bacterium]